MAHSVIKYPGNGTNGPFQVSFTGGFLSRSHVTAYVLGDVDAQGNQIYRTIEWLNDGLINVSGAPVSSQQYIVISRDTPISALIHDYQDGAIQGEKNLDESFTQALMLVQEIEDGKWSHTLVQELNANGYRVSNLLAGIAANDAITLGQLQSSISSYEARVAEATDAAATINACKDTAVSAAGIASEQAGAATAQAGIAATKAEEAATKAEEAATKAEEAAASAVLAEQDRHTHSNKTFLDSLSQSALDAKASLAVANTFTKTQTPARTASTPSAAIDWDASTTQVLEVTLTATRLFNAPTNLVAGTFYSIRLIGAYVPTWNAAYKNISSYSCATTATKADFLTFYCSDGTNLELVGIMYNCNGGA